MTTTTRLPTTPAATSTDWRTRAACGNEDPDLFFPNGTTSIAVDQAEEAKAVCRRCPVAGQCLGWALETGQESGIWGGLTEQERRRMFRLRTRKAPGEEAA